MMVHPLIATAIIAAASAALAEENKIEVSADGGHRPPKPWGEGWILLADLEISPFIQAGSPDSETARMAVLHFSDSL